jgi:class 3 adenylate cyclase
MAIKVLGLHHHAVRVAPSVEAAAEARRFYVEVLGLSADEGRPQTPGVPGHWLDAGEQAQLHVMGVAGRLMDLGDGLDPSEPHVALAVEDIGAARAELERLGVAHRTLRGLVDAGTEQVFLRDPAGNLVELHQADSCRCSAAARREQPEGYTRVWSAVMFADMRGFTGISEQLRPNQVVPLLNEYFSLLTEITMRHGGRVFHLAGDGLMAGFGVPEEQADAPGRAVLSARSMLAAFSDLAFDWRRRLGIETGLGIGINAGEVIAGQVGSPQHRSYTIVGDTVNVASRLSQRARAGEALFSASVRQALDAQGLASSILELPALQLRGRASPVDIFCIPAADRLDLRPLS